MRMTPCPALQEELERNSGPLRCPHILYVKDVLRIHPDDPILYLEPLKGVATEAFRHFVGVDVEPKRKWLMVVTAERD
jgi:hypothetical protein